jgi:hypothetical protein
MVLRSQIDTLSNQSVHSQPAHSEKFISREGVAKQLGGAEVMPSAQVMPLADPSRIASAIPIIVNPLMSPLIICSILALLLIAIIWFVVRKKIWGRDFKNDHYFTHEKYMNRPDIFYLKS